jgi:3-oxoacyl-(acyl-carrier-protein) synthase
LQLGSELHFIEIVIPAWQAYLRAELQLSHAIEEEGNVDRARFDALREGGAAAFYLHHFADIVASERPHFLPHEVRGVSQVQQWVAVSCRMLRTDTPCNDVSLLGDIVDALKHSHLTRRLDERDVAARDAVVVVGSGMGELGYGEGKYGGVDQVLILANSGTRPLSSILQNVIDAWRTSVGWYVPEIGEAA